MGFKGRTIAGETDLVGFQDKLYEVSSENKPIYNLTEFMKSDAVIDKAIHNIKSNHGSKTAGVDGKTINDYLQMDRLELLDLIKDQIDNYSPQAVLRKFIPKTNGKLRPLGIPVIVDRIIQEIARMGLEPFAEAKFFEYSYGFRPYRSTEHAIARLVQCINHKHYIAIEGDIKGYFDNINHNKLIELLWNMGIKDKRFLMLIKKMLKAKISDNGDITDCEKGTPQGGIISPLLANIYLNNFDWSISSLWETHEAVVERPRTRNGRTFVEKDYQFLRKKSVAKHESVHLVRYADDWIIMCQNAHYAENLLNKIEKYLSHQLGLELSREKTLITDCRTHPVKFLGFRIYAQKKRLNENIVAKVYPDMDRAKTKIREISDDINQLRRHKNLEDRLEKIELINSKIIGLTNYYSIGISKALFSKMDNIWVRAMIGTFRKLYRGNHTKHVVQLKDLSNRVVRHEGYTMKTYAEFFNDSCSVGITRASCTKIQYARIYDPKWIPYTQGGRSAWHEANQKPRKLHLEDIWTNYEMLGIYARHNNYRHNFEYYMNRPYAIKRDKAKCACCKEFVYPHNVEVHHRKPYLTIDKVNKVPNLVTLCPSCHYQIHSGVQTMDSKIRTKLLKLQDELIKRQVVVGEAK